MNCSSSWSRGINYHDQYPTKAVMMAGLHNQLWMDDEFPFWHSYYTAAYTKHDHWSLRHRVRKNNGNGISHIPPQMPYKINYVCAFYKSIIRISNGDDSCTLSVCCTETNSHKCERRIITIANWMIGGRRRIDNHIHQCGNHNGMVYKMACVSVCVWGCTIGLLLLLL